MVWGFVYIVGVTVDWMSKASEWNTVQLYQLTHDYICGRQCSVFGVEVIKTTENQIFQLEAIHCNIDLLVNPETFYLKA
jgi:hypothetical protein